LRLSSITVQRFRSITKAYKLKLGQRTVLVGPNNEGKSNILRALAAAMNIITREEVQSIVGPRRHVVAQYLRTRYYEWERDFPVDLKAADPQGTSVIILEFALSPEELKDYKTTIKSKLSGTLPLKIQLDRNQTATVTLHKKGPGAAEQSQKSPQIAKFVAERLRFELIQAVRTARSSQEILDDLVAKELSRVEREAPFQAALMQIDNLQRPILDELSANIKATLVSFLPAIRSVQVVMPPQHRSEALRRACHIYIDDGTRTLLQYKGDGVQSLAALGIIRHVSETSAKGQNLVIAIEEPESHLHPGAMHELKAVLGEMAAKHQIVLTTHSPLFVDRVHVTSNILVSEHRARPARNIEEIRTSLGVRAADNLRNADLALVVEGSDDAMAISALLSHYSPVCRNALISGALAIDHVGGTGNLLYKLSQLRLTLCLYHCFLDDDDSGRSSSERAVADGLLDARYLHLSRTIGRQEAELEDWYRTEAYEAAILSHLNIQALPPRFFSARKWSRRLSDALEQLGRPFNDRILMEAKYVVAKAIAAEPGAALLDQIRPAFDDLVGSLERRLEELKEARRAAG